MISEYYKFLMEGSYECEMTLGPPKEGSLKDYNLILARTDYEVSFLNELMELPVPVIFLIGEQETRPQLFENRSLPPLARLFVHGGAPNEFVKAIDQVLKITSRLSERKNGHCRIRTHYLLNSHKTVCDIYLKLSDDKFVKIFNRFQTYGREDIQHYLDKKAQFVYIKEGDYRVFIDHFIREFNEEVKERPVALGNANVTIKCQETVHDIIANLGINENAVRMTNMAITATLEIVQKSSLSKLVDDCFKKEDYISEHSLLLSYIACALCKETEWGVNKENILRLCLAAFFHDITIDDEEVARLDQVNSPAYEQLSREMKMKVKAHPTEAVEIIEKMNGLPPGVDNIILKHHERYDGSGFPRGIDYKRMEPMCVIFVVAHELVDTLYDIGFEQENIQRVYDDFQSRFSKGAFPKVLEAMGQCLNLRSATQGI